MSTNAGIIDPTPIRKVIDDLKTRADIFLDSDPNDPRGKTFQTVWEQLTQALKEATAAERWGTPEEVGAQIGIPADTVRMWARQRRIESRRATGTRRWQVRYPTWERQ